MTSLISRLPYSLLPLGAAEFKFTTAGSFDRYRSYIIRLSHAHSPSPRSSISSRSLRSQHYPFVLLTLDYLERVVEMPFAVFDARGFLLVAREIGVDELDEPVKVFRRDLHIQDISEPGHLARLTAET